jgi:hypothetical protein
LAPVLCRDKAPSFFPDAAELFIVKISFRKPEGAERDGQAKPSVINRGFQETGSAECCPLQKDVTGGVEAVDACEAQCHFPSISVASYKVGSLASLGKNKA